MCRYLVKLINTPRMLSDYTRKDSHRLWGYHLLRKITSGFLLIVPTKFADHRNQISKKVKLSHFASKIMHLCTTGERVTTAGV